MFRCVSMRNVARGAGFLAAAPLPGRGRAALSNKAGGWQGCRAGRPAASHSSHPLCQTTLSLFAHRGHVTRVSAKRTEMDVADYFL